MKTIIAITAAAATFALGATPLAAETRTERAEARMADKLEGRVAGEPQSCITAYQTDRIDVVEHVGITYERGDTIWLARASNPRSLGYGDIPIIERHGSQLCKSDIIKTVDSSSGIFSGTVFLGDFVPYTKANEEG